jgi:dipeptidyl aminopeptidase/acylaminoacyl peptidase
MPVADAQSGADRTIRPVTEPRGALDYDLAFDRQESLWSSALSVSRDGQRAAYSLRQPPAGANLSSRIMPNGSPSSVVGSRVMLSDRRAGRSTALLPPGAKRGDRLPALVLMYPGGDRSRESEVFGGGGPLTVPTLLFTSRGYAVVLASLPLGPNRQARYPVREMVDQLLPQVYRAAELGYIDVNRLAIGGQSFGGYGTAAIIGATNLFRAAIAVSGIYDLARTYGHLDGEEGGSFWVGWSEDGQARMGTHPWANVMRYLESSPYYRADKIHTPLLMVHGNEDTAYHDAQKLFSALRRLERPVQLATYKGMGHVIYEWTRPNSVDAARRMVEFVRKHLGDPLAPKTIP